MEDRDEAASQGTAVRAQAKTVAAVLCVAIAAVVVLAEVSAVAAVEEDAAGLINLAAVERVAVVDATAVVVVAAVVVVGDVAGGRGNCRRQTEKKMVEGEAYSASAPDHAPESQEFGIVAVVIAAAAVVVNVPAMTAAWVVGVVAVLEHRMETTGSAVVVVAGAAGVAVVAVTVAVPKEEWVESQAVCKMAVVAVG
jgi:hypothetical protein